MPARLGKDNLVARPDRADFRDRAYQPPLRSLPSQYPPPALVKEFLPQYVKDGNILDQGREGACTGFGLAAVINYIYWSRWVEDGRQGAKPPRVSPHMLYRNARLHDEWEGSDYEGSSCRGAMKGWYKQGVCKEDLWRATDARPDPKWSQDATWRPLGAYYRVDAKSVADLQAAIFEVHSVYCSASVHGGWDLPAGTADVGGIDIAVIEPGGTIDGGHAFALVGYTRDGFIVQNSWGEDWGTRGFALLTYEDWIRNGNDAWAAALGAPMRIGYKTGAPAAGRAAGLMAAAFAPQAVAAKAAGSAAPPLWTETEAYEHAVVMGNDGKLLQRLVDARHAEDALRIVAGEKVVERGHGAIAVYVHGGLNSEDKAIARARRMGPWFEANGIHPIFIVWRTGLLEALGQIGQDQVARFEEEMTAIRARGLGDLIDAAMAKAHEAFDRAFEAVVEKLIVKAVWSQMKQNAAMAARPGGSLGLFLKLLGGHEQVPVHLLGHSAGAIMIGHLLDAAARSGTALNFASCGLYAPACTLEFAAERYGKAMGGDGPLARAALHIDNLTDEAEIADSVGPYGKSLLYLVSRALEDVHKTPLLGLAIAHGKDGKGKLMSLNAEAQKKAFAKWNALIAAGKAITVAPHPGPNVQVSPSETVKIAHGTFDNDLAVVNASLARILGRQPGVPVTDLSGF